jgi:hypothetical protein
MKKGLILLCVCFFLSACGAYAPHNQWKVMKFTTPPDRTEQDRMAAESDCIKLVDEAQPEGMVFLKGAAWQYTENARRYQNCMAEKGFTCKDDKYPCPYEPGKK